MTMLLWPVNRILTFLYLLTIVIIDEGECEKNPALKPLEWGPDAALAAVNMVVQSRIFPPDNGFLRRISCEESNDGWDISYATSGGMWKVPADAFKSTKEDPALKGVRGAIKREFGIDWEECKWRDLKIPLRSALAARMYLYEVKEAIPERDDTDGQTAYFLKYYLHDEKNDAAGRDFDYCAKKEAQGVDMFFLFDGSDSMEDSGFEQAKSIAMDIVDKLVFNNVAAAAMEYPSNADNDLVEFINYKESVKQYIARLERPQYADETMIAKALRTLVDVFAVKGRRQEDIRYVAIVFTDGRQSEGDDDVGDAAAYVRENNIELYAVGTGNIETDVINQIGNDPDHVFFNSFDVSALRVETI